MCYRHHVTSNLDPETQRADHRQGGGGIQPTLQKARKFFQLKILTSNPYGLKILQTVFADPAPVKAFQGVGGGGVPPLSPIFPKREASKSYLHSPHLNCFFGSFSTVNSSAAESASFSRSRWLLRIT